MSTPKRVFQFGQSGAAFMNQDTENPTIFNMTTYWQPVIRALVDPGGSESLLQTQYLLGAAGATPGSAIGGNGLIHRHTSGSPILPDGGDGYRGQAGSECFIRPAAPGTAEFGDWTVWPFTDNGQLIVDYADGLTGTEKGQHVGIAFAINEYDVAGYDAFQAPWALNDPRVWAFAAMRMADALRTALAQTAAECALLLLAPIPYVSGTNRGYELVWAAMNIVATWPGFNAHIVVGNSMDCVWDRDDGFGGNDGAYRFHPNWEDQAYTARKRAFADARVVGPLASPTAYKVLAGRGPKLVWAHRVTDTVVRVSIEHDGGSDFTLPPTPTMGWRVTYGGQVQTISSVTKADARTIEITLASPCAVPEALRVHYGWGNVRLITGGTGSEGTGGIYDNAATYDPKAIPAAIAGADRLNHIVWRTPPGGLRVHRSAPAADLLLPLAS